MQIDGLTLDELVVITNILKSIQYKLGDAPMVLQIVQKLHDAVEKADPSRISVSNKNQKSKDGIIL